MSDVDQVTRSWIRNRSDELAAARGYFFHPPSAERVIEFSRRICHKEPLAWQADTIRRLYGWRKPDGSRRFTRGYITIAKKNGKTFLGAVLGAFTLICERGDVVSAANSRGQAAEVFKDMQKFVKESAALQKYCTCIPSTKSILVKSALTSYHAMSADAGTGDGVRAKLAIYDEYHRAKDSALYDILQPAGEGQVEPLFLVITTSGESLTTPCGELYEYAKRIAAGNLTDDAELGFFSAIYEAETDDDISLETTWRKANPALGEVVSLERFRADYLEAAQSLTRLATFRRLRLNQWISAETEAAWLNQDSWAACSDPAITLEQLRGRECWGGLDLSSTTDVTALALVFKLDDGRYYLLLFFWLPAADMQKRERRDGVPYWAWAQDEANNLTLTDGNVVDYAFIRAKINALRKVFDIRDIAVDRWNAQQIINDLTSDGLTMVPFGQGFGSMNSPSKEFERLTLSQGLAHGNNPLLNHMASKAIVETDAAGNIKPSKKKSAHRIDGIVAGVMALGRAIAADPPLTESLVA